MKSWLVILGLWALVALYWRQNGVMHRDLAAARRWAAHIFVDR